ncbi:MAG: hypothetical protein JRI47_02615 [Deltaproteobacteria bacterium]|nr:hypothetical protein [Deltaproteobacteria bacterium]
MDDGQFVLDKEAEELFEKLGGIEKGEALSIIGDIARAYQNEQASSDPWRILMIELVYEICTCFLDYKFFKGAPKTEDHVAPITAKVRKLSEMPNHDGQVLLRYRGLHSSEINPIGLDYLISFQDLIINLKAVPALAKRHQATQAHLHEQLIEALSVFRANNITTLFVQVPAAGQDTAESMGQCIRILSQYYQAVYDGSPIIVTSQGKSFEVPLVRDHENKPDPNLTLVAGLNRLDKATMDALVSKVDHLIGKESIHVPIYDITNTYNAIFSTEQLQEKLIKPPLEVNNVKWLMLASDQEILHKEKMDLVNTVFEKFGGASQEAVQIINTIYEGNFEDLSPYDILGSLGKITTVLDGIETGKKGPGVERELLGNIQDRLDPVRDEVLESLTVKGDLLEAGGPGEEPVSTRIHGKIIDLVMFFKGRSKTRKKLIAIMTASVTFDDEDYDIIGRMFCISPKEARHLVEAIEACFDEKGGFLRKSFEDRISELAKYGENIFFFLWFYLKEMRRSTDRVSFLNALQFLLARLDRPEEALSKLLEDFVSTPTQVLPSDRDAIVLGNILVRKENWEIGTEIEITPEEVLRIEDNVNPDAVKAAVQAIHYREDDFIKKIETIHSNTMEWLEWATTEDEESFLKYLLSLAREMYIFLSIVDPPVARHVLRSAILAYGDPQSQVYGLKRTRENLNALMTLLRVVIRAFHRVGNREDLIFLGQIKEKHNEFIALKDDAHYFESLTRIMDFSDKAREAIEKRAIQDRQETA